MKVTYIGHSGFLVETEEAYLLFDCVASDGTEDNTGEKDYSTGTLPVLDDKKQLVVFVSHQHGDHYSHDIWKLKNKYLHVKYVISKDIPFSENARKACGISEADLDDILRVRANQKYELVLDQGSILDIETIRSTDMGVAFYLTLNGHTVFHAGDLNLWLWEEEGEEYNDYMSKHFFRELERLKGRRTDVAFLLLDPRQEKDAFRGMDAYLNAMDVRYAFPMHFWKQYDLITAYKEARKEEHFASAVQQIEYEGQVFDLPEE